MNKKHMKHYMTYNVSVANAQEVEKFGGRIIAVNGVYMDFYLPEGIEPSFPARKV